MFFNQRPDLARQPASATAVVRQTLLLGTILGAGWLVLPGAGQAATVTITSPITNSEAAVADDNGTASDDLTITTTATVTSTGNAGIVATRGSGAVSVTNDAAVLGFTNGIYATSSSGAVTVSGSSAITSTGFAQDPNLGPVAGEGIYAKSGSSSVTVSGTGATSAAGIAIRALIDSGTEDILISRSGAVTSGTGGDAGKEGILANNAGSGKVTISGIGAVTATGVGISATAAGGAINIGTPSVKITKAVSGTTGISATNTGSGTISIATGAGGTVASTGGVGISTSSANGATTIDVGADVTGTIYGISSDASGGGTTSISIGSGSTVTGGSRAIYAKTKDGNVTVANAGSVRGAIEGALYSGGTGTFTFNNTGTFTLLGSESNTGFAINNQSGGVLTGTGSFGAVNAASGSFIRPGDRTLPPVNGVPVMGTLKISGLTLTPGALVEVRADYAGASDKVEVSGAAALGGATLRVLATPQTSAAWDGGKKTYTVLTAGTLTGTFATVTTDYAYLKASAVTSGNSVIATLERNWTSFGTYSTTPNQKSVSDVFDKFQTQGSNPLISKVTTLTIAQAPVAMAQLSGSGIVAARAQSFAAAGVFTGAINAEMGKFTGSAGGASSVLSYAPEKKVTKAFDKVAVKPAAPILDGRVWMQVLGGVANMKSDATNPSERSTNFGLAAGADTALTPNLRAGFALSGGQSTTRVSSLATRADATWGQGALYAVATDGDRYAKAALVYGYLTTETERKVTAFEMPETAKGKFGANLVSTRLEVGQSLTKNTAVNLTPFAAFEPSWLMQNSYTETGSSVVALGYGKTTARALPATLGVKAESDIALDGMRLTPSATLGWVHNFTDTSSISPFFAALPGSTFTVAGAKGDRNLARTEFNLEATPNGSTATFYANARADLGARTTSVRGTAGFMMRF